MNAAEAGRIAALRRFDGPDGPSDAVFDRVAALAADLFAAPIGLVILIDETHLRIKGRFGLAAATFPRDHLPWPDATRDDAPATMAIADAQADPRYRDWPSVTGEPHLRFYAAAALVTPDGFRIGTVSAMDRLPRPPPSRRDLARLNALAGIVMDELDLRRAHQASLESERLLGLAEGMAAMGHWRYELGSGRTTWSDGLYRIHGMTKDAGPPSLPEVSRLYSPKDWRKVEVALADALAGRSDRRIELQLRRPGGGPRRVVATALCERDDAGALTGLFGIIQDVTEQAAATAALREREARYRLLAEQAADIIVGIGLDGRIGFVAPSVEAVAGRRPADLRGAMALDVVHPDDRASLRRHFARMRRPRLARMKIVEFRAHHADGRWIWLEANPTLVIDPASGEPSGWVDILRDIGLRKAQDAERTAALQAAAQEKSDLLANLSHEIRTPLNSIIGFTQVLKRDASLGEVQLGQVDRIEEAGRSLLTVVNDVLELSKLESGTVSIARRAFSPAKLVRDTAALMRPQAADKGLRLVVEVAPAAVTPVIGDPDRLRQILLNLLSNAVKFTGAGEVRLKAEARTTGASLHLGIAVEDSGIGIAPEHVPNLFQRYTQANGSIGRRFGGTGLGLAISKRLADAMEASIAVESTPKVGSRFLVSLVLPVAEGPAVPDRPRDPDRAAAMRGKRLLVAEDVETNRKLVQAILSPLGCLVDAVGNGADALAAVQRRDYALVLMDMQMPGLDGLEATRAIRALGGRFARLPILALTANVFPEQSERAQAAGMDDLVTKPIDADHLIETVIRWSSGRDPLDAP